MVRDSLGVLALTSFNSHTEVSSRVSAERLGAGESSLDKRILLKTLLGKYVLYEYGRRNPSLILATERMHVWDLCCQILLGVQRSTAVQDRRHNPHVLSKSVLHAGCRGLASLGCDLVGETCFDISAMQVSTGVPDENDGLVLGSIFPHKGSL